LRRGSGLLIVTGPTGSGKTTTLYSALNFLREMSLNIITVEDPVEIQLEGLEQVQVRHVAGMDFSRVLRNVLRHDPDVIMIGEIRDEETAKIAVQAAQTDHLVLTTLHTNSAADTILRLKDMDIEPYMIASALLGIISQRLLKRNCNECRIIEEVSPVIMKAMNFDKNRKFYVGKGCDKCNNTGVSGRIPAYEFLRVSPEIREAIINNSSSSELNHLAKSLGMQSMTECGLTHAGSGKTSLSEVHRINLV
jgi:type IV pilus assembly protein PilB